MADWTKQDIIDIITEYLQNNGSAIGNEKVRELTQEELTSEVLEALSIPSMMPSTEEWVQTSLRNMMRPVTDAVSDLTTLKEQVEEAADTANDAAASVEEAISTADSDHTRAEQDHTRAEDDHERLAKVATEAAVRSIVRDYE